MSRPINLVNDRTQKDARGSKRLTEAQLDTMRRISNTGLMRISELNIRTIKALMKFRLINYDSSFDNVKLTAKGQKADLVNGIYK
jgi:hypothetical protein